MAPWHLPGLWGKEITVNLQQADLFEPIRAVYEAGGTISNAHLYARLATDAVVPKGFLSNTCPSLARLSPIPSLAGSRPCWPQSKPAAAG